jgi:glucokinase
MWGGCRNKSGMTKGYSLYDTSTNAYIRPMTEIVAGDIGGTNARFARATLTPGERPQLRDVRTYKTAAYPDLASAWRRFLEEEGAPTVSAASFAVAGPLDGGVIRFTNSPWVIETDRVADQLGLDKVHFLNDFGAMAHGVAWLEQSEFAHLAGPDEIPVEGVTSVIGPGTGLGVAMLLHRHGSYEVIETEGGHLDFAPLDPIEQQILDRLRERFRRVSVERIVSGPGLGNLYEALAAIEARPILPREDAALWASAIDGTDQLARTALDRLILSFGSASGDLVLGHGANQLVIVGGLANRIRHLLQSRPFHERFCAKGRYAQRMARFPIRLALHDQPGLLGAAAAFARS